jgi:hypothetical protein
MTRIYVCAAALFAVLVLAACGSGKSGSSGNGSASSGGNANGKVSQRDCQALGDAVTEIQAAEVFGFDYAKTRTFFDTFNPPDKIHDDFGRLKDVVDKLASAEEDAGVKPGDQPVGDQITKIQGSLSGYSESDKAKNGQALASLGAYHSNGCD